MFFHHQKTVNRVVTWRHFDGKSYSAFNSLKREIRIGVLAVSTLLAAHNDSLATRPDSLQIAKAAASSADLSLGEATVTGSQLPVSLDKTWSKIVVISRQDIDNARCQTINDILKLCPNVDVRQRGAMGVQTDISLGGGTFDQITFLLNGININNPQTGHLSADFPVAIADIERIEILDGASARIFGSQALNGIINIVTRIEPTNQVGIHTEGGSYGTFGGGGNVQFLTINSQCRNRLSLDYLRSDGAVDNSGFSRTRLFGQGRYGADGLRLNWQAGYNGQRYGANTFYSALYPNQWEENSRYMAALKGEVTAGGVCILPTLSFIRNYDHFQLIRGSDTGENFHRTDVLSAAVIANVQWSMLNGQRSTVNGQCFTAFGSELRHEGILSTNLGRPLSEAERVRVEHRHDLYYDHRDGRTNMSLFLEQGMRRGPWSLNVGIMANRNSAVDDRFRLYPGVDINFRPRILNSHRSNPDLDNGQSPTVNFYVSWNKSMRMPTFTDLYYKSPTQEGNVGLKPEQMNTFKLGAEVCLRSKSESVFQGRDVHLSIDGIYRRGADMIDWVMYTPDDIYHSAAFRLSNWQFVAQARWHPVCVAYYYNVQRRHDDTPVYQSCYALDYLRHKVVASVEHGLFAVGGAGGRLSATWYFRWQQREGTHLEYTSGVAVQRPNRAYSLLDLKLCWKSAPPSGHESRRHAGRWSVYSSFENLFSCRYYDVGTVPQPGFTFLLGAVRIL